MVNVDEYALQESAIMEPVAALSVPTTRLAMAVSKLVVDRPASASLTTLVLASAAKMQFAVAQLAAPRIRTVPVARSVPQRHVVLHLLRISQESA